MNADITEEQINEIKKDIKRISVYFSVNLPFLIIPFSYMNVKATREVETAGVDGKGSIYVNPDFWRGLTPANKKAILIHEALHIALLHPIRGKHKENHDAWNIATDCKINYTIRTQLPDCDLPRDHVNTDAVSRIIGVNSEALGQKYSCDEIYNLLIQKSRSVLTPACILQENGSATQPQSGGRKTQGVPKNSVTVKEADAPRYESGNENEAKSILAEAAIVQKMKSAGTTTNSLDRLVQEIMETRPPWNIVIRSGITGDLEKSDATYSRPNRRTDDLPGYTGYRYTLWVAVDCSGSITDDDLRRFLGVAAYYARQATIKVLPWDTEAYEVTTVHNAYEARQKLKKAAKGGGGTVITKALEYLASHVMPQDGVIILTDGEIRDSSNDEYLYKEIANKTQLHIAAWTEQKLQPPGWKSVQFTRQQQ